MTDPITPETYNGPERRSDDRRQGRIEALVEQSIQRCLADVRLVDAATHQQHHDYIEAVLKREAERAAIRRAIIEKTLAGLVWTAIVFLGTRIYANFLEHWKP